MKMFDIFLGVTAAICLTNILAPFFGVYHTMTMQWLLQVNQRDKKPPSEPSA